MPWLHLLVLPTVAFCKGCGRQGRSAACVFMHCKTKPALLSHGDFVWEKHAHHWMRCLCLASPSTNKRWVHIIWKSVFTSFCLGHARFSGHTQLESIIGHWYTSRLVIAQMETSPDLQIEKQFCESSIHYFENFLAMQPGSCRVVWLNMCVRSLGHCMLAQRVISWHKVCPRLLGIMFIWHTIYVCKLCGIFWQVSMLKPQLRHMCM